MSGLKQFVTRHPRLTAWIVLAVGMVAILVWSARDVGLIWSQWLALIIATIGLAGLCVWIIGWEEEESEEKAQGTSAAPAESSGEPEPSAPSCGKKAKKKT